MSVVSVTVEAHIAYVTLNRPDKKNAVNMEMFAALADAGDQLASDTSVRCVVVSGAGGDFCAGIDVGMFASSGPVVDPASMSPAEPSPANLFQRAAYVWRELEVPVVCAISGVAFGAGMQIALGADIRYAAPDARFSIMEIKWGLVPDMAITTTARHLIPIDKVKELSFTGRVVDASEAQAIGLITATHDEPLQAAAALASDIAARSPTAVRAMKRLFNKGWGSNEADSLRLEAELQSGLLGSPNQIEAVMANIEKREPKFAN